MSVITTTYFVAKLVNMILLIEADWPFQHMSLGIYIILTQCVQCPSLSVFFFNYKTGTSNNYGCHFFCFFIFCKKQKKISIFCKQKTKENKRNSALYNDTSLPKLQ